MIEERIQHEMLPSLAVGSRILYEKNPDNTKIKQPEWVKGTVKEKFGERK